MRLPPADCTTKDADGRDVVDVTKARALFRSLLPPRPSVPIKGIARLPPLRVRALSGAQLDALVAGDQEDIAVVAAGLGTTEYKLRTLTVPEAAELAKQTRRALQRFPVYGYSEIEKWSAVLEKGAKGTIEGHALGACCRGPEGERPDLYWGLPLCDLLDCHWIAFRAARRNYKD